MAEKTLKTRVVLKHDSDTNWAAAGAAGKGANFVPKSGEVIVYEYSDGSRKFKIGNGKSTAAALPFQNAVGPTGPTGASGVGVITKLNGSTATGQSIYAPITGGTGILYGMGTGSAPQWLTTSTVGLYLKSTGGGFFAWSELSIDDGDIG